MERKSGCAIMGVNMSGVIGNRTAVKENNMSPVTDNNFNTSFGTGRE
jgi:hypothetical protein